MSDRNKNHNMAYPSPFPFMYIIFFHLHYPILYATSRQHIWTILHVNFIFRDTDNYIITQNPMVGAAVTTAASVEEAANYSLNLCYFPRSSFTLFCTLSYSYPAFFNLFFRSSPFPQSPAITSLAISSVDFFCEAFTIAFTFS